MTTADEVENEIERNGMQFMYDLLHEIDGNYAEPLARLYTSAMAWAICQFVAERYSPAQAYNLMQGLADAMIEQNSKPSPGGQSDPPVA